MGVLIPTGYGQVRFLFQLTGKPQPYVVTYGVIVSGDFGPEVVSSTVRGCFVGAGKPYEASNFSSDYTFLGVDCTVMTASGPVVGSDLTSVTGSMAGSTVPPNCCQLVRKNTTRGGRKGRGRAFYPPIHYSEGNVDAQGNILSPSVTAQQTKYNSAMTAWLASSYPPQLLHEDGSAPNPITSLSLQSQLATQRRRLR